MSERGFTLVEMLIALAIFGMLTAAGVTLLSFSVRAQDMADARLEKAGDLRRAAALIGADLNQAVARPYRDEAGARRRAFEGGDGSGAGGGPLLAFVRSGWDNPDGRARSSLQRVEYRLESGRLERIAFPHVDGAAGVARIALLEDVRQARLRYRDRDGAWRDRWDPVDGGPLPRAVELVADTQTHGALRLLFQVGP
jgi:general secretion pathway protein J